MNPATPSTPTTLFNSSPSLNPVHLLDAQGQLSWKTRAFLKIRWSVTPFFEMVKEVPQGGRILDLGCGHGMFALLMAMRDSSCEVYGVDHESARIEVANSTKDRLKNTHFVLGSLVEIEKDSFPINGEWKNLAPFKTITLIDVMHYFPFDHQMAILKKCFSWMEPGGTLLIREVNPNNGFVSQINRAYEKISTTLGITRSDEKSELFIRSVEDWHQALKTVGFEVESRPCTHPLFSDVLFVGKKASAPHS
jgi:2-polyprenyl-3-methyl-5-hydroxy-6-metoxy-1,4-benzoquinol methylase